MYNIKTTHIELINIDEGNGIETEVKTSANVEDMSEVNKYIKNFISTFSEYADDGLVKIAVFHTDDYGKVDTRLFYTYQDGEMISFNKDRGCPRIQKPETTEEANSYETKANL